MRRLIGLSSLLAALAVASAANATVLQPSWSASPWLAESRSVPENVGGLLIRVTAIQLEPEVPAELWTLGAAEQEALLAKVEEAAQIRVLDSEGQPRDAELQLHEGLFWLAAALEPGRYTYVADSYTSTASELLEVSFEVVPAVALPQSVGSVEAAAHCEPAGRYVQASAHVELSEDTAPFASVLVQRWSADPAYLGNPCSEGVPWAGRWEMPKPLRSSHWCSPVVNECQAAAGHHQLRLETLIAGLWQRLPDVEANLSVDCRVCADLEGVAPTTSIGVLPSPAPSQTQSPASAEAPVVELEGSGAPQVVVAEAPSSSCSIAALGAGSATGWLAWSWLACFMARLRRKARGEDHPL